MKRASSAGSVRADTHNSDATCSANRTSDVSHAAGCPARKEAQHPRSRKLRARGLAESRARQRSESSSGSSPLPTRIHVPSSPQPKTSPTAMVSPRPSATIPRATTLIEVMRLASSAKADASQELHGGWQAALLDLVGEQVNSVSRYGRSRGVLWVNDHALDAHTRWPVDSPLQRGPLHSPSRR